MQCPLKYLPVDGTLGQEGLELGPDDLLGRVPVGHHGEEVGIEVQEVGQGHGAASDDPEAECTGHVGDDVLEREADRQGFEGRNPPTATIRATIRLGFGHDGAKLPATKETTTESEKSLENPEIKRKETLAGPVLATRSIGSN